MEEGEAYARKFLLKLSQLWESVNNIIPSLTVPTSLLNSAVRFHCPLCCLILHYAYFNVSIILSEHVSILFDRPLSVVVQVPLLKKIQLGWES